MYKILVSDEFAIFTYNNPSVSYDSTEYMTAGYFHWNISDDIMFPLIKLKLQDIKKKD